MTFPYRRDVKLAIKSMRSTKARSFLTILGIVIGIVSVVTVVAIAQGVKVQVSGQIDQLGKDLITVRPGQLIDHTGSGSISGINLFSSFVNSAPLTQNDVQAISDTSYIKDVVPLSIVSGQVRVTGQASSSTLVIGSTDQLPDVLNQKLAYGEFFNSSNTNQNVAVIGKQVALDLFGEQVPLGRSFELQSQNFIVIGVFNQFDTAPLSMNSNFNNSIFIPDKAAQAITNKSAPIYEILVKPNSPDLVNQAYNDIKSKLLVAHGGVADFTVLRQNESLAVTNSILGLLTDLIAGIAAISLLVGGIGIMNVMLVSVTERTREIGIRKAVGATNRQIMSQFLIEAMVLSVGGGVFGIILSFMVEAAIRGLTSLEPIITWQIVLLASGVSLLVGIVFGSLPAAQAARKDPIESLRFE